MEETDKLRAKFEDRETRLIEREEELQYITNQNNDMAD